MKIKVASIALTMLLAACFGGDGPTPPVAVTPAQQPVDEDKTAGLKGVDANTNNIRDDIDRLIATKFSQTPDIKKAVEQKAVALQSFMEVTTKEQALTTGEQIVRASSCVYKVMPGPENQDLRQAISKEIEAATANTRERVIAYINSNEFVGGEYFSQPEEPLCN